MEYITDSPSARIRCLLLASTAGLMPVAANAQSAPVPSDASAQPSPTKSTSTTTSTAPGNEIQDIVVTAQRREQRGNDVGIAMNVLTGADLAATGTKQVVDLASQTTNVQIKNVSGKSIPNVTIRGIGLNDYASNNNPAAGVYVDNVYLVSPAMLSFGLFDVDRVEVLKGPQGDLYGRNTTAGAINIISRRPTDTPDVEMEAGYGSYQSWHFDGAAGGPLAPGLDGRFAFTTEQQDSGWQRNYVTGKRVGKVDRSAARLQLAWAPSESFKARLSVHGGYDRSDEALFKVDNNPTTTEEDPYANQPRVSGAGNSPNVDNKSFGASLTFDWSLDDALTLTSISAYEHFKRSDVSDIDGTSLRQLDGTFVNRINQGSQELRLAYSRDTLNLIAGGYYSRDTVFDRDTYDSPDLLPLFGLPGLSTIGNTYHQKTHAYAAFVHGEWAFAPRVTLIGGLRYTHEHKTFDNATTFLGNPGALFDVFPPVTKFFSTSKVSGKVGLNFKAREHTLFYASISRGFKSGGFQGQLTFDPNALNPFRDESVTAYEVGIKSRVLPNLQINGAAFDYEYKDAQFYGPLFDSPVGVLFGITNVGNARVRGIEGDALWRPVAGLDIHLGAGFIDTKITRSIVPGVAEGSRLPNAPRLTLNGRARYSWRVSDRVGADISVWGSYQSRIEFDIVRNPPQAIEGGYWLANAEVGANFGDHFRLSVFGKNLFDKLYRTQALFTSVGWTNQYGSPRIFGVNLSYRM